MQQYSQEPANQANIQPAMHRSAMQRENSRLQLSRTYRIVFLIRTQDKVKTIYPSKCYNWIYKADSKIVAQIVNGQTRKSERDVQSRENILYNAIWIEIPSTKCLAVCDVHGKIDNDYDIGHSNWFYKLQDNIKRLTGRCLVVISSFLNSIEVPFRVDKYFFYGLLLHTAVK